MPIFEKDQRLAEALSKPILELNQYFIQLSQDNVLVTPRELIMIAQLALAYCKQYPACDPSLAAKYYAYQLTRQFAPPGKLSQFDAQFKIERPNALGISLPEDTKLTITETNTSSVDMLIDFLKLRDIHNDLPAGLGGVLLEGMPGLGKSELSIACLRACGLTKRAIDDKSDLSQNQKYFYHLPATADPKIKEEILIRAFHEGAVVVYDELNSAASLETLLNRLLMGKGPHGEKPNNLGFMIIATQNPTAMAGRAKTSTAILHRLHYRKLEHYTKELQKRIATNTQDKNSQLSFRRSNPH